MAKDETMIGITGLPIPKKKMSPAKQHEFEKKRRANLGTNVGGERYKKDVTPGYNPRSRTFEEFMSIAEAVSASDRKLAQSGILSKRADDLQREIDAVKGGKKPAAPTRSARRITKQDYEVKEETAVADKPPTKEEKRKIALMQKLARLKAQAKAPAIVSDVATKEEFEIDEAKVEAGASDVVKKDIRSRRFVGSKGEKNYDAMGPTASNWVSAARLRAHKAARGVKKEDYEIDEAKVDVGLSDAEKKKVRTARQGYAGAKLPGSVPLHTGDIDRRAAHRERDELNKDAKDIRKSKLNAPQFQGTTGAERLAQVKKAKGIR